MELERVANRGSHAAVSAAVRDDELATNLPLVFSSFVGRERDLAALLPIVGQHRVVTLVGVGGVGKTRLALRVAEDFASSNSASDAFDGLWFADLASLTDPAMLLVTLATSVGLHQCGTHDDLLRYLRVKTFLLILDNCEHLLEPVTRTVSAILSGCPSGRIIATSRQALGVEGERVYRVSPLALPPVDTMTATAALDFDAIRLFKDRAEATDSRFQLTDDLVPSVTKICRQVDGIALAVELAAARTNAFSLETIAQQIGERLSLLSGGVRNSLERHKTMHGLFQWSYDLLEERERELFRRLSIFASGFTLDLAAGLYDGPESRHVPALLGSLVDKSLVHCDIVVGPRYRLLEPARQYGREKLTEQNEFDSASRQHARSLIRLAENFDARLDIVPDHVWYDQIERERENFRAVFEWSLRDLGDPLLGQRLAASRSGTWSGFATGEVRTWIDAAVKSLTDDTEAWVRAKLALNAARADVIFRHSWHAQDDPEAQTGACRRALLLQAPGDLRGIATAKYWLGTALRDSGRFDEADEILREARATARTVGAQTEYNAATTALAVVRYGVGDLSEARALIMEALQQSEDAGSDRVAADARAALAEIEFASGRIEEALRLNEKTTEFFLSHANLIGLPLMLSNSAAYLVALGRYGEAREYAAEALRRSRGLAISHPALWAMQRLAAIAVLEDNRCENADDTLKRAGQVLGFVDASVAQIQLPRYGTEQQEYDEVIAALRQALGTEGLKDVMAVGSTWTEEHAIAEALAL